MKMNHCHIATKYYDNNEEIIFDTCYLINFARQNKSV